MLSSIWNPHLIVVESVGVAVSSFQDKRPIGVDIYYNPNVGETGGNDPQALILFVAFFDQALSFFVRSSHWTFVLSLKVSDWVTSGPSERRPKLAERSTGTRQS